MNYYKLAMKVFNEHKSDFVKLAIRRDKLKQKLILQKMWSEELMKEKAEIKKEIKRLNNLIGGLLK